MEQNLIPVRCYSISEGQETVIPPKTVLCLGNFDGVHLGHQTLLKQAEEIGKTLRESGSGEQIAVGVFCFAKPSWEYLHPQKTGRLTTDREAEEKFRKCGMEYLFLGDFPSMQNQSPREFAEFLTEKLHCVHAICGFNYRFGKGGEGTPDTLKNHMGADRVTVAEPILWRESPISSSRIRQALENGCPEEAGAMLGEPYSLTAEVVHGKALGRKMGFPTVNQTFPKEKCIPKYGVYGGTVEIDGKQYTTLTNVGVRPTLEKEGIVNSESHVLGYSGDLYGKTLTVSFQHFLRLEQTFSSVEELKKQIDIDRKTAEKMFVEAD